MCYCDCVDIAGSGPGYEPVDCWSCSDVETVGLWACGCAEAVMGFVSVSVLSLDNCVISC